MGMAEILNSEKRDCEISDYDRPGRGNKKWKSGMFVPGMNTYGFSSRLGPADLAFMRR